MMQQQQYQQQNYQMYGGPQQSQKMMAANRGANSAAQQFQCTMCSYRNPNEQTVFKHQFDKNHVFFCGFESTFAANNHMVTCDKWFYSPDEMQRHQNENGHFYGSAGTAAGQGGKGRKKQQPQQVQKGGQGRAHDFYEDMRAQNRQVPSSQQMMQQPRQQKMAHARPQQVQLQYNDGTSLQQQPSGYQRPRSSSAQNQRTSNNAKMNTGGRKQQMMLQDDSNVRYQGDSQQQLMPKGGVNKAQKATMNMQQQQQMPPIYECTPCQKSFSSQAGLVMHVERVHPESGDVDPSKFNLGLRPLVVTDQTQTQTQPQNQQRQRGAQQQNIKPQTLRSQSQATLQPLPKTKASYQLQDENSSLQQNQLLEPAYCNQCGKQFLKGQAALERHQMDTGHTQQCACEVCGKLFSDDVKLSQHVQSTGHNFYNIQGNNNKSNPRASKQAAPTTPQAPAKNPAPRQQQRPSTAAVNQQQRPPAAQQQRPPAAQQQRTPAAQQQRPPAAQQQRTPAAQQQRPSTAQQQRPNSNQQQMQQQNTDSRQGRKNAGGNAPNPSSVTTKAQNSSTNEAASQPQIFKCEVCFTSYKTNMQLTDHRKTPEHTQKVVATAQKYAQRTKRQQHPTK